MLLNLGSFILALCKHAQACSGPTGGKGAGSDRDACSLLGSEMEKSRAQMGRCCSSAPGTRKATGEKGESKNACREAAEGGAAAATDGQEGQACRGCSHRSLTAPGTTGRWRGCSQAAGQRQQGTRLAGGEGTGSESLVWCNQGFELPMKRMNSNCRTLHAGRGAHDRASQTEWGHVAG